MSVCVQLQKKEYFLTRDILTLSCPLEAKYELSDFIFVYLKIVLR
jgi:hypothetical protein